MLAELFVFLTSFLLILSFVFYKIKFAPLIAKTWNWTSIPSWPIIGSAHCLIGINSEEILLYIIGLIRQYQKNHSVKFWFAWDLNLFTGHPEDVEIIMTSPACIEKSMHYSCLKDWLREGLLISNGKKWHQRRKLLTPAFHFSILKDLSKVSQRQSYIFVEKLKRYAANDEEFDVFLEGGLLALDVICETAMGVRINAQANADSEYVKMVKTISFIKHKRMFKATHYFPIVHKFTKLAKLEKTALTVLHEFTEKVIKQRRLELIKKNTDNSFENPIEKEEIGIKRKMSFLDILLQSNIDGKPLADIEIREEVDTFMFEGHDTTSSAISFFFYNMAVNPEYQQKCYEEIKDIFGTDPDSPIDFENLSKLHFVELCIKETLRMFPSVPIIGRKVAKEIKLSDGKIIPAGSNVITIPYYLGRCEEFYEDANSFKPERFEGYTSAQKMNPFAYIPFSAGQRNCIGQKFALLELKTIIVNVLRNFIVTGDDNLSKDLHLTGELILRTKNQIKLKVLERRSTRKIESEIYQQKFVDNLSLKNNVKSLG